MRHTASTPSTNQSVLPVPHAFLLYAHWQERSAWKNSGAPWNTGHQSSGPLALDATGAPVGSSGTLGSSRALGCGEDGLPGRTPRGLNTPASGLARRTRPHKRARHTEEEEVVRHLTRAELEAGLEIIRSAPRDEGVLELIVRRPAIEAREVLDSAELHPAHGLVGDTWSARGSSRTPDGTCHPDMQLNIMVCVPLLWWHNHATAGRWQATSCQSTWI